jgi:ABC-type methionine transport system ATPase subunit
MKEAESQYKQLIKELSEEAIPSNLINKQIEIKSDNETNKEVINESPEKKPKVSKSKKSINDDNKILESNIKNINDTNLMENQIEIKVKKSIKKKVVNTVVEL